MNQKLYYFYKFKVWVRGLEENLINILTFKNLRESIYEYFKKMELEIINPEIKLTLLNTEFIPISFFSRHNYKRILHSNSNTKFILIIVNLLEALFPLLAIRSNLIRFNNSKKTKL